MSIQEYSEDVQRAVQKYSNALFAELKKEDPDTEAMERATELMQDVLYKFESKLGKINIKKKCAPTVNGVMDTLKSLG